MAVARRCWGRSGARAAKDEWATEMGHGGLPRAAREVMWRDATGPGRRRGYGRTCPDGDDFVRRREVGDTRVCTAKSRERHTYL